MKEKELLNYLTQDYIPSRLSLYYRKEIQKMYSDNYIKGRLFKKKGLLPKTKDNEFIMDIILRLKSMQYNDKVTVNEVQKPFITHFLNKAEIEYTNEDNKFTVKTSLKEKLTNFFKKIDLEQLSFNFGTLTPVR